jgi:conjugative transfer region protein TrbK
LIRRLGIGTAARAIGFLAIKAEIMVTDVHLRHSSFSPGDHSDARAAGPNDALARELRRCQAIGMKAKDAAACQAAWAENRRRFFAPLADHPPALSISPVARPTR